MTGVVVFSSVPYVVKPRYILMKGKQHLTKGLLILYPFHDFPSGV